MKIDTTYQQILNPGSAISRPISSFSKKRGESRTACLSDRGESRTVWGVGKSFEKGYLQIGGGEETSKHLKKNMPLTRRFGFVFTDQCTDELAHTIAHELGHGPFHLYHTFSTENGFTQAQGSTDNLMDYSGVSATSLYKYQWDNIQDPQAMIGLLQDEEEGAYEYFISDEFPEQNLKAELAFWKWRENGFPTLSNDELMNKYHLHNDYSKDLFRGICLDYDKIKTKAPDIFEIYAFYYELYLKGRDNFTEEDYAFVTTIIKEHYALGNKIVFESLMSAGASIKVYFEILTMVSMPGKLPVKLNIGKSIVQLGNMGKAISALTKTRAGIMMGRLSLCFAKTKPELWLKNFLVGAGLEAASSFTSGIVLYEGDVLESLSNIDWVDVAVEGTVNIIYGKASSLKQLFRGGTISIVRGTSVITLKMIKASTDLSFTKGFESIFADQDSEFYKSLNEVFISFVIDMGKEITTQEFLNQQKIWAKADIQSSHFAPLDKSQKALAMKINTLVNNELYRNMIDYSFDVVKSVFEQNLSQNIELEVEVVSVKPLTDFDDQPVDNTYYDNPYDEILIEQQ